MVTIFVHYRGRVRRTFYDIKTCAYFFLYKFSQRATRNLVTKYIKIIKIYSDKVDHHCTGITEVSVHIPFEVLPRYCLKNGDILPNISH